MGTRWFPLFVLGLVAFGMGGSRSAWAADMWYVHTPITTPVITARRPDTEAMTIW